MSSGDGFDSNSADWSQQSAEALSAGEDLDNAGWTQDEFDVEASEDISRYDEARHVKVTGAIFGKSSIADDVKTGAEIQAYHVDEQRDADAGIALSRYNLNYVFNKKVGFKVSSLSERLGATIDPKTLPAKVDLRADAAVSIYDQGQIGSCVSNSASYGVRRAYKKNTGKLIMPSRLFIYFNGRVMNGLPADSDSGLTITEGYRSVDKFSAPSEALWPYDQNQFKAKPSPAAYAAAAKMPNFEYVTLNSNILELKKCLADGFYVSFGTALFSSFMSAQTARTGVIPNPDTAKEQRLGGHAMTIVGYDDSKRCFIVANSWSARWGDKGFCYFPYDYMLNKSLTSDFCSARTFG